MERRNLKPGDVFKIKDRLERWYDACIVSDDMKRYCGKIAKIKYINTARTNRYYIDLDNGHWNWTVEMFETIITNEK